MVDPAEHVTFYWLTADGTKRSGSERELQNALRNAGMSAAAFVWRAGWAEWLPAHHLSQSDELAPDSKRERERTVSRAAAAHSVKVPSIMTRPPLASTTRPVALDVGETRPATPSGKGRPAMVPPPVPQDSARDTLAPSSFGVIGTPRVEARRPALAAPSSTPPAPPLRARSPMPTLSEEQGSVSATATLRPPGAVPPPARGVPAPALDSSPRAALLTPIPSSSPVSGRFQTASGAGLSVTPEALGVSHVGPREAAETLPPETEPRPAAPLLTRVSSSAPATVGVGGVAREPARVVIAGFVVDGRALLVLCAGLTGALFAALVALWFGRGAREASTASRPNLGQSAVQAALPPPLVGCQLALPAGRVAGAIERTVPPYAAKVGANGLALGLAETKTKGLGLHLDPRTLDVLTTFEEDGVNAVRGVVPLTRSSALTFFVDRDDRTLRSAHTIDEVPPFTLGVSVTGFSRVLAGSTSLIWALTPDTKITEPRSAALGDFGHAVTFRRGGQAGAVMLGFVTRDGEQKSVLAPIPDAPKYLGTPVIAASGAAALVAFAGRDAPDAPWQVYASLNAPGAAPSPARVLVTASGGGAISPTLSSLPDGQWLVQWTEGLSGQSHVHVQRFASNLSRMGDPVLVSPKGANAGQGSLVTFEGGAVTLFILTTAGHDELWGATLACR